MSPEGHQPPVWAECHTARGALPKAHGERNRSDGAARDLGRLSDDRGQVDGLGVRGAVTYPPTADPPPPP
eukprot:COSAG02_NODE_15740_length_1145_cov_0.651052_1_plen_69_part_10